MNNKNTISSRLKKKENGNECKIFFLKNYFTQFLDKSRRILFGQELENLISFSGFSFFTKSYNLSTKKHLIVMTLTFTLKFRII